MHLGEWEATIQKIVDEYKQKPAEMVLAKWRAQLEKEPTRLKPFQIDQIMREVRERL
jgi:hypothetical protein